MSKKQKYSVTKWRNTDIYLSFFTPMSCAVSTGITKSSGFICDFLQANMVIFFFIFWLLLPMRTLYRTDRNLPEWLRKAAFIARIYCAAILVTAGIYGVMNLSNYADNVKNH